MSDRAPSSAPDTGGSSRRKVYFTFGNHQHWVDMQWLWGYGVLPDSVRDMLHLCREANVRGCVNFDGIGYEKMAAECPEALAELREAVRQGIIEPVGCSYGQPYGLFNGGESNIRQFTYGVRSVRRLLGLRPRSFWEEEFYFFPQLPQILKQCGFTGANLFFQWTWHTPEIPFEPHALIMWEGIDGTRLPTLPRNELNLHQWPEEFAPLFESSLLRDLEVPAIVQWIELNPSPDWMCRSELLLPKLRELQAQDSFELVPTTMGQLIDTLKANEPEPPMRHYTLDDVWHGMTLGKNADRHPRQSIHTELTIRAAETLAAVAGLFGRPYPSWDVYPTWELDEAWRDLLAGQHHDNHECEGLCGHVGHRLMEQAQDAAQDALRRTMRHLEDQAGTSLIFNPSSFARSALTMDDQLIDRQLAVPPFGFRRSDLAVPVDERHAVQYYEQPEDNRVSLISGEMRVVIDTTSGVIRQIRMPQFPDGILFQSRPLLDFEMICNGKPWKPNANAKLTDACGGRRAVIDYDPPNRRRRYASDCLATTVELDPIRNTVNLGVHSIDHLPKPDAGFKAALRMPIRFRFPIKNIIADSAAALHKVGGSGSVRRKYPSGDWMTSAQWFEEVDGAFTSLSLVDLVDDDGSGVLILHDGSKQWFRTDEHSVEVVLSAYDAWDEDYYESQDWMRMILVPHRLALTHADRAKLAEEFQFKSPESLVCLNSFDRIDHPAPVGGGGKAKPRTVPPMFGPLGIEGAPSVLATAFHRESMKSGEHFPDWAGHEMFNRSEGACDHPYVIRLVEYDGVEADVSFKLAGEVASAAKTNLMGEVGPHVPAGEDTAWLDVEYPVEPPEWTNGEPIGVNGEVLKWSAVRFKMRPREIATIMADMVMGRKVWRNLDAKREVWATIHRTRGQDEGDAS